MPYISTWIIEQQVALIVMAGAITRDELRNGIIKASKMTANSSAEKVHIFVDMRHMTRYPMSLSDLNNTSKEELEAVNGYTIMISNNQIINFISRTILAMSGKPFKSFSQPELALAHLAAVDNTLTTLPDIDAYEQFVQQLCNNAGYVLSS